MTDIYPQSKAAKRLQQYLSNMPYLNYVYSYPHKTSYRDFEHPVSLEQAWMDEEKQTLFLYVHIPFCEMRCGYCNLFTTSNPEKALVDTYLLTLHRHTCAAANFLGSEFNFEQVAIGGGTPTYLSPEQLHQLFTTLSVELSLRSKNISIEVSPKTADKERLAVLTQHGATRISIGVESFNKTELHALGRPQSNNLVEEALLRIRDTGVACLNIDLIYGSTAHTPQNWRYSLDQALSYQPEELFIYPLYIRPLTGLGNKQHRHFEDHRMKAYFDARDCLLNMGYLQTSMRKFVREDVLGHQGQYHCQEDGMIGLGAGARSYTQTLHYSSHYAVKKRQINHIISQYNQYSKDDLSYACYGYLLNREDQCRRFALLGLLQTQGLERRGYEHRFGKDPLADLPELNLLETFKLGVINKERIQLNEKGIAYSDLIGNWLFSDRVRSRMEKWHWK
jgi:oxygen-independent coproporphyrinogen-3 oxidase